MKFQANRTITHCSRESSLINVSSNGTSHNSNRPWLVLLLGGASGVGKTSISYQLAHHYHIGLTEVDDFQVVLEAMTSPTQYPVLHFWRTHRAEALAMTEDERLDFMLRYDQIMDDALTLVIANHLETCTPLVLEGDFILPSLAVKELYVDEPANGRVRAVFLHEDSEQQLRGNFQAREHEDQPERARGSYRHSQWLYAEAQRLGVPTIHARPWDTVLQRVIATIDTADQIAVQR